MRSLQPAELAQWLADPARPAPLVLDVREPWEFAICALPDAVHIPMREIPSRATELDAQRPVVCLCHHGVRSARVAIFLERQGFGEVWNLDGGIDRWSAEVDPRCPTY